MTEGGLARYREEESARGPGHGTAPGERGPKGTGMKISAETHYVAAQMALNATQALATNLAAYLAGVARVDGSPSEEGAECVRRLLADVEASIGDTGVTDLRPGTFDADMARKIALDTVQTYVEFVTERLL